MFIPLKKGFSYLSLVSEWSTAAEAGASAEIRWLVDVHAKISFLSVGSAFDTYIVSIVSVMCK